MASAAGDGPTLFWKFSITWPAWGALSENVTRSSGRTVALRTAAIEARGVAADRAAAVPKPPRSSRPASPQPMRARVAPILVASLAIVVSVFVLGDAGCKPGKRSSIPNAVRGQEASGTDGKQVGRQ
jgi:hypothetical protein